MIKVNGRYSISKDGGISWVQSKNMLVKGYYESSMSGAMQVFLGGGTAPVSFEDSSTQKLIGSDSKNELSSSVRIEIDEGDFIVVKDQVFSCPAGAEGVFSEVGLYINSTLISRSLISDEYGTPTPITVQGSDNLKIRYSIGYTISARPLAISLDYKGETIQGDVRLINPNKWGGAKLGEPVRVNNVMSANNVSVDANHYLEGGAQLAAIPIYSEDVSLSTAKRIYLAEFFAGLPEFTGIFNQLIFCDGVASTANGVAIVQFDSPIEKTDEDTFGFTISFVHES